MDNGFVGNAAMPRPMPLPTRPAVADSLAQERGLPQTVARPVRQISETPTTAEPDPVPQSVAVQASSGETRDPFVSQLDGMAEQMSELARAQGRSLEFLVEGASPEDLVILVRASDTGEVVRTIPAEELSNLSRQVREGNLSLVSLRA